jgi:hypothetical protein
LLPLLQIVALVAMAPLPLMRRHLCHNCNCYCQPHDDGVVAVVIAQVSLLSSSWHYCPHNNDAIALDPQWRCFPCCNGLVSILKLVLSPLLQWCLCHHQCTGILINTMMVLLSSFNGVLAVDVQAPLLSLQLQYFPLS